LEQIDQMIEPEMFSSKAAYSIHRVLKL